MISASAGVLSEVVATPVWRLEFKTHAKMPRAMNFGFAQMTACSAGSVLQRAKLIMRQGTIQLFGSTDAETVMWHGATTCKDSKNEENNGTPPGGPFGAVKLCSRSWSASTASADSEPFHTKSVAMACLY